MLIDLTPCNDMEGKSDNGLIKPILITNLMRCVSKTSIKTDRIGLTQTNSKTRLEVQNI